MGEKFKLFACSQAFLGLGYIMSCKPKLLGLAFLDQNAHNECRYIKGSERGAKDIAVPLCGYMPYPQVGLSHAFRWAQRLYTTWQGSLWSMSSLQDHGFDSALLCSEYNFLALEFIFWVLTSALMGLTKTILIKKIICSTLPLPKKWAKPHDFSSVRWGYLFSPWRSAPLWGNSGYAHVPDQMSENFSSISLGVSRPWSKISKF